MKQLTNQTYQELLDSNTEVNIIYFSTTFCPPCKVLSPLMEVLSQENDKATFWKNIMDEDELDTNYHIKSVPTIIFTKNGKEEGRLVGGQSKKTIQDKIDSLV